METTPHTVRVTLAQLRDLPPLSAVRRHAALEQFWQRVLLIPPQETGHFPWAQVRRGIEALARSAPHCSEPASLAKSGVLALLLAGNTPLLAWPVLHYAVLLGIPVFIKQSRDETIWTRHFVETLATIDPEVAALLHLDRFPGDDPRTHSLVQHADAVIAYGGDGAIAALREATHEATPFQGFGHALSVGIWPEEGTVSELACFCRDWLMYDQAGCLSPQALFFKNRSSVWIGRVLTEVAWDEMEGNIIPPRTDPAECRIVREARELALMEGCEVLAPPNLRWTLILHPEPCGLPLPTGLGVLHLIPLAEVAQFGTFLGSAKGRLSSVGVAGELSDELRAAIEAEGVSRICQAGTMQTPPLDWHNGGVDLRDWLLKAFWG